jgi:hypothetical protein
MAVPNARDVDRLASLVVNLFWLAFAILVASTAH